MTATTYSASIRSTRPTPAARYTVVIPSGLGAPAPVATTEVFIRRRLMVALVFVSVVVALWVGAGSVLANRGGAPASTSAVRPATTYVVQPGDTLWAIAQAHHGAISASTYLDALVTVNDGSMIEVGQVITLP